jgi:hypothetical protein
MSVLDAVRGRLDEGMRQARLLEELWKARLEVDVPGLFAGVRARLESSLPLTPVPIDAELTGPEGPLGWGNIHTEVYTAPRVRKIVLTSVSQRPVLEGFALVLLPDPELAAPVFACDFMGLPTRISVNADCYGTRTLGNLPLDLLSPLRESFGRLGGHSGPPWSLGLASGIGLHARVSPRLGNDAFAALSAALGRALEGVAHAQVGPGGQESQAAFFRAFHAHGPRKGPIRYLYGPAFAERYSRLVFE